MVLRLLAPLKTYYDRFADTIEQRLMSLRIPRMAEIEWLLRQTSGACKTVFKVPGGCTYSDCSIGRGFTGIDCVRLALTPNTRNIAISVRNQKYLQPFREVDSKSKN